MFCSVVKKVKIQDRCVRGVKIQDFILLARIVDVFQKLMISLLSTPHPLNWKIFKIGGHVPMMIVAPLLARDLAIAHP